MWEITGNRKQQPELISHWDSDLLHSISKKKTTTSARVETMAHEDITRSERILGSRRTRSQAAPDWSAMDSLILVNEIAAVEADCLKALSSYQKWQIISENCAAQDVPRNFNQCRRKWDSLLLDYNRIKQWESKSRGASYWSLERDRRDNLGLPRDFDDELFLAIENLVMARENQPDTDPESDAEAKDDLVDVVDELGADTHVYRRTKGSKRQRRQLTSQETFAWKSLPEEKPIKSHAERRPPKSRVEMNPMDNSMEETPVRIPLEEKLPQWTSMKKKPRKGYVEENETGGIEDKEQRIALILRENAEMINSIVSENAGYEAADVENVKDPQTESAEFVRCQGDKLIACLGDIVKSLDQLCDLVQECE